MKKRYALVFIVIASLTYLLTRAATPTIPQIEAQISGVQNSVKSYAAATQAAVPGPWMGINTGGMTYWSYDQMADLADEFSGWWTYNGPAITYDKNGYPTSGNAAATCDMLGVQNQDFNVTWNGTVNNLQFVGGQFQISAEKGNFKRGMALGQSIKFPAVVQRLAPAKRGRFLQKAAIKFDVTSQHSGILHYTGAGSGNGMIIVASGFDSKNPFSDFHIWHAGYGPGSPNAGKVYLKEYTAPLGQFACIRTMNSTNGATSREVNWSDRMTPAMFGKGNGQQPWEYVVAMVKETGVKELWVTIPAAANADYCKQLATYLKSALPGIKIIYELGDEPWNGWGNGSYYANTYDWQLSNTSPTLYNYDGNIVAGKWVQNPVGQPGVTDGWTRNARCAADQERNMARVVLGVDPTAITCLSACAANSQFAQVGLQYVQAKYGDHPFKAIIIAPYYDYWYNNGQFCHPTGGTTTQPTYQQSDCWYAVAQFIETVLPGEIDAHVAMLDPAGPTQVMCYEGDQSFYPNDHPYDGNDISTHMQLDWTMQSVDLRYFQIMRQHGVSLNMDFAYISSPWDQYGYWSLIRYYGDNTPRWRAAQIACQMWNTPSMDMRKN